MENGAVPVPTLVPRIQKIVLPVMLALILPNYMYGHAVTSINIIIWQDNPQDCNGGAGCPDGQFCNDGCRDCSICPSLTSNLVRKGGELRVVGTCAQQGLCPNVCYPSNLQSGTEADQSLCAHLQPSPVCQLRSCDNGGILSEEACQCECFAPWNGTTCSDCGLSCLNGGTLDKISCQCSCANDWTGSNCSVPKADISPSITDVPGNESFPVYASIIISIAGAFFAFVIWCIVKRIGCLKSRSSSWADSEAPLLPGMDVTDVTSQSISVKAVNPCTKFQGKQMKFSCRREERDGSQDAVQWSDAMTWQANCTLWQKFERLPPGTAYVISLHQQASTQVAVKSVKATTRHLLSLEVQGSSATLKGLQEFGCNTVEVCPCLNLRGLGKWIRLEQGQNELVLSDIPPGFEYTVKAGLVDYQLLSDHQTFKCIAENKVVITEDVESQTSSCKTFMEAARDLDLRRSLQVELNSSGKRYLPEIVAKAFKLEGDDYLCVKDAREDHIEKLCDILSSKESHTHVTIHSVIDCLKQHTYKPDAEDFIVKLVGYTWDHYKCSVCTRLLHQSNSMCCKTCNSSDSRQQFGAV
ncbi:uncharacterized protein LOC110984429 [Acanthaster planci]|uniref:Uncharacterized protein LOC110984429 n=1 Tax=Acanthaster planci TaxID=133434 RepID=A0A8B7ZAP9_ACAPL|nr:uncharacterized protein LOC110984429 [Acanthaster planci]